MNLTTTVSCDNIAQPLITAKFKGITHTNISDVFSSCGIFAYVQRMRFTCVHLFFSVYIFKFMSMYEYIAL